MSTWLRLIAVFVVAVLASLLLKGLHPVLVGALFVGGTVFTYLTLRDRVRREARIGDLRALGFRSETQDPFGLLGYPFALFGRISDAQIANLLWGPWQGTEVKMFECSFATATVGDPDRERFSCVIAPVGATCPHLVLEPEIFFPLLGGPVGLAEIAFEDAPFARVFRVGCDDEAFARALIDGPMGDWLAGLGEGWGFEVSGALIMVYGPGSAHADLLSVLEPLREFLDRVPLALRTASTDAGPSVS